MKISKAKISRISALKLKKNRDKEGLFLLEGDKSVRDSLPLFSVLSVIATRNWIANTVLDKTQYEILEATPQEINKLSSMSTPPEVIAVCRIPDFSDDLPDFSKELVLVLDGIQDPGNLGTIIRTADWFGIRHIFASRTTADVYSSKVVQSTMGSLARVRVHYVDISSLINQHQEIPVCGLLLDGSDIYTADLPSAGFIVMGNEGRGITPEVRESITHPLLIPPFPRDASTVDSLNVAIATGITLAEFRRRNLN